MDARLKRFCVSIKCKHLKDGECKHKECKYPDKEKAVQEYRDGKKGGK